MKLIFWVIITIAVVCFAILFAYNEAVGFGVKSAVTGKDQTIAVSSNSIMVNNPNFTPATTTTLATSLTIATTGTP